MDIGRLKAQLLRGSLTGGIRILIAIPVYLILTPLALRALGTELFAIWSFSAMIAAILNLTDVGLKPGLVYFVARHGDDPHRVNDYFNATFWTFAGFCVVILGMGWGLTGYLVEDVLAIPAFLRDQAEFVVGVTLLCGSLRILSIPFESILEGYQDVSVSQAIQLMWLLFNFMGSLVVLIWFPGIYGLGVVSVAAGGLLLGCFRRAVKTRHPAVRARFLAINTARFREMLGYGAGIQVAAIVIALREPLYKIMILRSGGLNDLATFEISYKLCVQAMSIVAVPLLGLFGAVSLLSNRRNELREVLRPALACSVGLGLPMLMFAASFADRVVPIWLGPTDLAVARMLPAVAAAFVLYYSSESLYRSIQGLGGARYCAVIQSLVLAINVGGFALLVDRVGIWAYPLSLLAGFAVFSISNAFIFRRMSSGERLFAGRQVASLLWPSCLYGGVLLLAPAWARPLLFVVYVIGHVWALKKGDAYDFVGLGKWLIERAVAVGFGGALHRVRGGRILNVRTP